MEKANNADIFSFLRSLSCAGLTEFQQCGCPTHITSEERESDSIMSTTLHHSWMELYRSTGCFTTAIGQKGESSAFYSARLEDLSVDVALKVFERPVEIGFEREIEMLSRIDHPNVVQIFGWSLRDPPPNLSAVFPNDGGGGGIATSMRGISSPGKRKAALVYEMLPGGNALDRLCSEERVYPWEERLLTSVDLLNGLVYLRSMGPAIFHRDIKTANILFTKSGTAKIADFEILSAPRKGDEMVCHSSMGTYSGSPGYSAPEVARTGVVTEASEVFSVGVVLGELITALSPVHRPRSGRLDLLLDKVKPEISFAADRMMSVIDPRAEWHMETVCELTVISSRCLQMEPKHRPSLADVSKQLENLKASHPALKRDDASDRSGHAVACAFDEKPKSVGLVKDLDGATANSNTACKTLNDSQNSSKVIASQKLGWSGWAPWSRKEDSGKDSQAQGGKDGAEGGGELLSGRRAESAADCTAVESRAGAATRKGVGSGSVAAAVAFYATASDTPSTSSSATPSLVSPSMQQATVAKPLSSVPENQGKQQQEETQSSKVTVTREKCPKGHQLLRSVAAKARQYSCNECQQRNTPGQVFWCCRFCDWDSCEQCLQKSVDALASSSAEHAAALPRQILGEGNSSSEGDCSIKGQGGCTNAAHNGLKESSEDRNVAAVRSTSPLFSRVEATDAPGNGSMSAVVVTKTVQDAIMDDQDEATLAFLVEAALNPSPQRGSQSRSRTDMALATESVVHEYYPEHEGLGRLHHICEASP
eukprot:TRINITY_DN31554_c0_g1_i1.p1 TRINITY_DN31554_c0_g1~~TRINITY_DN31554_c0_g1_i1.p1  ORF type:complete len:819 (-),score=100.99 TRINITY_DN31554_c0_g1_i1:99-2393(-)